MTFPEWLATSRKKRGHSLRSLGRKAGMSDVYMGYLEKGERDPSREAVLKIAEALDVPSDDGLLAAGFVPDATAITYEQDGDSIPLPEGRRDSDPVIHAAASSAAADTYKAVAEAMRKARQRSPGTQGFGNDRYGPEQSGHIRELTDDDFPETDGGPEDEFDDGK